MCHLQVIYTRWRTVRGNKTENWVVLGIKKKCDVGGGIKEGIKRSLTGEEVRKSRGHKLENVVGGGGLKALKSGYYRNL